MGWPWSASLASWWRRGGSRVVLATQPSGVPATAAVKALVFAYATACACANERPNGDHRDAKSDAAEEDHRRSYRDVVKRATASPSRTGWVSSPVPNTTPAKSRGLAGHAVGRLARWDYRASRLGAIARPPIAVRPVAERRDATAPNTTVPPAGRFAFWVNRPTNCDAVSRKLGR